MNLQTSRFASFLPFASAAALAWGIVACSSSSSSSSPPPDGGTPATDGAVPTTDGGLTTDTACGDYAQARCARLDACSNATYTTLHYGGSAACVSSVKGTCVSALEASQTAATQAFFEACGTAIASEACADLFGANPPAACATLSGPVANGAPCFGGSQCTSTYCAIPANATCGTCAAVPQVGDPCTITAECGSRNNLACNRNGTCVTYSGAGGNCGKDAVCGPGFSCIGYDGLTDTEGTCATAGATVGAACQTTQRTVGGCDLNLGLDCTPVTETCELITLVAAGVACGEVDDGGEARCETSGTCVIPQDDAGPQVDGSAPIAEPKTGTCLAAAANGSPCDTVNGPACIPAAKCVTADGGTTGTCQLVDPSSCH